MKKFSVDASETDMHNKNNEFCFELKDSKIQYKNSPFYKKSFQIYLRIQNKTMSVSKNVAPNKYYNEKCLNIILIKWMPYVVFWSNIMGAYVDEYFTRISNAPAGG